MKIGDKIFCHKTCIIRQTLEKTTTIGKYYKIVYMNNDGISIIDDCGFGHNFSTNSLSPSYYKIWFYSDMKKIRKIKLKQINDSHLQ